MKTDIKAIDLVEILIKVIGQSDEILNELENDMQEVEEDISDMEDDLDCSKSDLEEIKAEIETVLRDVESLKQMIADIMQNSHPDEMIAVDLVELGEGNFEVKVGKTQE